MSVKRQRRQKPLTADAVEAANVASSDGDPDSCWYGDPIAQVGITKHNRSALVVLTAAISRQAVMFRNLHMHGGAVFTAHRLLSSRKRAFRCAPLNPALA